VLTRLLLRTYPALQDRNLRLFFLGWVISSAGTFLQGAAQGWLVYQMTHSALAVGITGGLLMVPTMLLAPFGGVIIDKFNTRRVLYVTQLLGMAQAFTLGALVVTGHASLAAINLLALALGVINGLDAPARHTWITELANEDILRSATALNSLIVNVGLALGPSVGGFLVEKVGMGGAFFVNGLSFVAVIATLFFMRVDHLPGKRNGKSFGMFLPGVRYAASDPGIRFLLCLSGTAIFLGLPYRTIIPAVAKEVFHLGPTGYGWLYAAPGFGAIIGATIASRYSGRRSVKLFIIGGIFVTGASLIVFSMMNTFYWGMLALVFSGAGVVGASTTIRTTLREIVKRKMPAMLGRVTGIDVALFFGGVAFGNFAIGGLSKWFGVQAAITCSGVALLLLGAVLLVKMKKLGA